MPGSRAERRASLDGLEMIRLAQEQDRAAWDNYVLNHCDAAAYNLFAWKEAVATAYGHKGLYLLAETQGKVCGVLPLICFATPWGAKDLVALPFCDTGEVLAESPQIRSQLIGRAIDLAHSMQVDQLEMRSSTACLFSDYATDKVWVQSDKVRMVLQLPASPKFLWDGFKSKLRSQIRKAEKNGLTFRWGNVADLQSFYSVFSRNMHILGSPVHSRHWIRQVLERFGPHAKMGLVFKDTQPVGCGIILLTRYTASIPWASTLREFNRLSPNMLLYWNFLRFAADRNMKLFDFGRSTPGEGTYRFKRQWGAEPVPLYWYHYYPDPAGKIHSDRKVMGRRRVAARLWSCLPLSVSIYLGEKLRKYISL